MISREFVKKYLDVKDMLESGEITGERYTALILALCQEYHVVPAKLVEYNMDVEQRKFK